MRTFLDNSEREQLLTLHRSEKDRRSGDRIKAILWADEGMTFLQIAKLLFITNETVSSHVHDYIESKKMKIESGGSDPRLNEEQTNLLTAHLEDTTYLAVWSICDYAKETFNIEYTVAGMTSWLHNHGFSFKQPKATPAKADPERQAAWIKQYNDLMNSTPEYEPILFGDAVHPTMATKVTCGWIRTGKDKPIATTASRTRVNLMGSLNLETMSMITTTHETINSVSMIKHFDKLRATYPDAPKIHQILDNGPYNISHATKQAAQERGIVLHYLPPYSPNLNPIERVWKVMNEKVRNNVVFKIAKEFRAAIQGFFCDIWLKIRFDLTDRINDNFQIINSGF